MNDFLLFSRYNFWASAAMIALIFAVDRLRSFGIALPYVELLTAVLLGVLAVVLLMLTLMSGVVIWSFESVTRPYREASIALFEATVAVILIAAVTLLSGPIGVSILVGVWFVAWIVIELATYKKFPSSE